MQLGIICSSLPRFKKECCDIAILNFFQNPNLSLPLFLIFLPHVCFELSFSITISLFVFTPFVMFLSPIRSRFSFFEFVCVQVQGMSRHFFFSLCISKSRKPWCFIIKFISLSPLDAIAYVLCAFPRRQHRCHHLCFVHLSKKTTFAITYALCTCTLCTSPRR